MRSFLSLALTTLWVAASGPVLSQEAEIEGSRFTVGDWLGGATALPDGQFDYCSVSMQPDKTTSLSYILRSDDAFVIIIGVEGARFVTGEIIEVGLSADTFAADRLTARVVDPATIAIPIPGIAATAASVRPSTALTLSVSGAPDHTLITPGTDAALDAALACFDKYSAPG